MDAGDTVWWLRLDDPDTTGDDKDETSDLTLGFSTRHFDTQYWYNKDDRTEANKSKALHYRFEVERHPSHLNDHPHFLAYDALKQDNTPHKVPVWSSAEVGISVLKLAPGTDITDLQWIFTDKGTYEIRVELIGFVNKDKPADAPENWEPISTNVTETSEVKRYVIQVGEKLAEIEPPMFEVVRSIPENADSGAKIGKPIRLRTEGTSGTIKYTLTGEGANQFAIGSTSGSNGVQIVVAEGASLDFDTKATYELILGVTNSIDHESNPDFSLDGTLGLTIELTESPRLTVSPSATNVTSGTSVTWTASITGLPDDATNVRYHWTMNAAYRGAQYTEDRTETGDHVTFTIDYSTDGWVDMHVSATYGDEIGNDYTIPAKKSTRVIWERP